MAGTFFAIVTDLGTRKIFEAVNQEKKVNITTFAVGDGGGEYYAPTTGMDRLINEMWRGAINSCRVSEESENYLTVEAVVPPDVGGFTIREMGIFDDEGTLIAICNTPDTQIAGISDGIIDEVVLSMEVILSNADSVQILVDPASSTATKKDLELLGKEVDKKVDAVPGKGLSSNDYTDKEKEKLAGIGEGAEANVQPDWNEKDEKSDAYIKNKPAIPENAVDVGAVPTNAPNKAKNIYLGRLPEYRSVVIGVAKAKDMYDGFQGKLYFERETGIYPSKTVWFSMKTIHTFDYAYCDWITMGGDFLVFKPCKFTYENVEYLGFRVYITSAQPHACIEGWSYSGTDPVMVWDYNYQTNTENPEVYDTVNTAESFFKKTGSLHYNNAALALADGSNASGTWSNITAGKASELTVNAGAVNNPSYFAGGIPKPCLKETTINLSGSQYDQNTWYPVVGSALSDYEYTLLNVYNNLNGRSKPEWSRHGSGFCCNYIVLDRGYGWGTMQNQDAVGITGRYNGQIVLSSIYGWVQAGEPNPVVYRQMTNSGCPVFYLRGGGTYTIKTSSGITWSIKTGSFTTNDETVRPLTTPNAAVDMSVLSAVSCNINGNAASASRLNMDAIGSATQPVYFRDGIPAACDGSLVEKTAAFDGSFSFNKNTGFPIKIDVPNISKYDLILVVTSIGSVWLSPQDDEGTYLSTFKRPDGAQPDNRLYLASFKARAGKTDNRVYFSNPGNYYVNDGGTVETANPTFYIYKIICYKLK